MNTVPFRMVGLTGGIASGKSAIANMLRGRGLRVIDADVVAREVVEPGSSGLRQVLDAFGEDLLTDEGTLDRRALGAVIFSDETARKRLEGILHPLIGARTALLAQEASAEGAPAIVYEAPLIVENNLHKGLHLLVVVSVDLETQRARLMARDESDEAPAQARIDAQLPLAAKVEVADVVIDNSGTLEETSEQVDAFVENLPELLWPDHIEDGRDALRLWLASRQETP